MDSLSWDSMIHGNRIYKYVWTPFVGEIFCVEQEARNPNHFAFAIVKVELVIFLVKFRVMFGTSFNMIE